MCDLILDSVRAVRRRQLPDVDSEAVSGKRVLAVRLGRRSNGGLLVGLSTSDPVEDHLAASAVADDLEGVLEPVGR